MVISDVLLDVIDFVMADPVCRVDQRSPDDPDDVDAEANFLIDVLRAYRSGHRSTAFHEAIGWALTQYDHDVERKACSRRRERSSPEPRV